MGGGPSRSAKRIVAAVAVSVAVMVALAAWVLVVPYEVDDGTGTGTVVSCDAGPGSSAEAGAAEAGADRQGEDRRTEVDAACEEAEGGRRTTALLVGAGVATLAAAVSTWPSRRLTGEELGPLR